MTLVIIDLRIRCWLDSRIGTRGWRLKTDAADVEVFLEAIELEEGAAPLSHNFSHRL